MNIADWSASTDPGRVVDLRVPGAIQRMVNAYAETRPAVLRQVLVQAYGLGAQMAMVEYRYLDPDYRNEHSRFYSTTFRRYPSIAHRLHFFREAPPKTLLDPVMPMSLDNLGYIGYSVLRPVPGGPVGRTMLEPPNALKKYVSVRAEDQVNVFGRSMSVKATPFISQDAQLTRCAHATLWVAAYYHHLKFKAPRWLPGEIVAAVPTSVGLGRPTPSAGLSIQQISEGLSGLGLPALVYQVSELPRGETLETIICRYLNSGMPLIVAGAGHAWVLVGYQQRRSATGEPRIAFVRQDDEVGPYQVVEYPQFDVYAPWEWIVVPLPTKVYLSGEAAERVGKGYIENTLRQTDSPDARALLERVNRNEIVFRSTVMLSNNFKVAIGDRCGSPNLAEIYRRMQMSKWIWVIEACVSNESDIGRPAVVADALIDATDHLRDLHALAWRIPGALYHWLPDRDQLGVPERLDPVEYLPSVTQVSQEVA